MSISNLLDQSIKPWCNVEVNNLVVDGSFTNSGAIISSGNILVQNANPSISIVNNTSNSNAAALLIQGATGLSPLVFQQEPNGDLLILAQDNGSISLRSSGSGNINLFPQGSGHVILAGGQYASITGNLRLSGGNPNSILATSVGAISQLTSILTPVTLNTPNGVITTQVANAAAGSFNDFTLNNSLILSSSVVLASIIDYNVVGTGFPALRIDSIANGSCTIHVCNYSATDALNSAMKIGFSIQN
ncbi:MAG TPA: hypothetical protein VN703_06570 [Candidatus Sulfopaludibacter sp.]|nr:hypothetical protein [Candidatus Sulfopaludibacter sp.]